MADQDRDDERYSDEAELAELRRLATEIFELELGRPAEEGSRANVVGIRSAHVLFSRRLDSRTYFVHDNRYGAHSELGAWQGAEAEHLEAARRLLERLGIPLSEVAAERVLKERGREGRFDRETGTVVAEEAREGKHVAQLTRAVEGLPVWSSGLTLGLTRERRPGYVQLHWPELPRTAVHEAHRLRYRLGHGWEPPARAGAEVESVEAGIVHSPAIAFLMDVHPAVRVIYRPAAGLRGQKPVYFLDRHGAAVPPPRQAEMPVEAAVTRARGEAQGG